MRARDTESVCPCPLPSVSDFSVMEACMESKPHFYKAKSNKDLNNPDMVCVREGRKGPEGEDKEARCRPEPRVESVV